jgi:hypothetical protein
VGALRCEPRLISIAKIHRFNMRNFESTQRPFHSCISGSIFCNALRRSSVSPYEGEMGIVFFNNGINSLASGPISLNAWTAKYCAASWNLASRLFKDSFKKASVSFFVWGSSLQIATEAANRTPGNGSSSAFLRAGSAILGSAPILPRASAALYLKPMCLLSSKTIRLGTAAVPSAQLHPEHRRPQMLTNRLSTWVLEKEPHLD